ncbi:MAG: hypothetical protein QOD14_1671 [Solirubrobacterales bacterium]|nr:hypothetical protein [Solirubrobacterales bacterium]
MRAEGLEPPRSFEHQDLNLDRLPVPARPQASDSSFGVGVLRMCDTGRLWKNGAPIRDSSTNSIDSREVRMTWTIWAATAVIGFAFWAEGDGGT